MIKVVGIKFRVTGRIYYFDPGELELKRGTHVIAETVRGVEYGTVLVGPKEVPDDQVVQPLKAVMRIATDDDEAREAYNRAREHEAYLSCKEKIREHGLKMKLIKAEYTFDNSKLIFYFTADGRVDFRSLVKDLASVFRTRIELRQIGVRDETKLLGGVGVCGRELCCHTFLSDFAPVSIRMAKEQNLSLNPSKISGVCGRLMCCLKNEAETYEYLNSRLPRTGDRVTTPDGLRGTVQQVSVLRQQVRVLIEHEDEKEIREYPADALKFRPRPRRKPEKENRKSREHRREMVYSSTDSRGKGRGHKKAQETEKTAQEKTRFSEGQKSQAQSGFSASQKSQTQSGFSAGQAGLSGEQKSRQATQERLQKESQKQQPSSQQPSESFPLTVPSAEPAKPVSAASGAPIGSVTVHNEKFVQNKAGELSRTTTHDVQTQQSTGRPSEGLNVRVTEEIKVVKEKTIDPSGHPVLKGFEVHETETVKVSGVIPKEPEAARKTVTAAAATIAEAKADALKEARNTADRPAAETQTAEVVRDVLAQEPVPEETADVVNAVLDAREASGGQAGKTASSRAYRPSADYDPDLDIIDAAAEAVPEPHTEGSPEHNDVLEPHAENGSEYNIHPDHQGKPVSGYNGAPEPQEEAFSGYYTGSSVHGNGSRGYSRKRRSYSGKSSGEKSSYNRKNNKGNTGNGSSGKDYRNSRSSEGRSSGGKKRYDNTGRKNSAGKSSENRRDSGSRYNGSRDYSSGRSAGESKRGTGRNGNEYYKDRSRNKSTYRKTEKSGSRNTGEQGGDEK